VKKILVVDDSETVRAQVRHALAVTGYEIIEAADGVEGVAKVRSIGDLAMALCDVNMPRMNGLEMVAEVRRGGSSIPIVMLTSEAQPSMIQSARQLGARGWIVKPFKPELLVAAVTKVVESSAESR
jgi:two-component system, chemotaxis family, chemotaxis protein CheY